jgi:hypothetical protein
MHPHIERSELSGHPVFRTATKAEPVAASSQIIVG